MSSGCLQGRRHMDLQLIKIVCKNCGMPFYVCRSCYHRQAYCCEQCRSIKQREKRRIARKKYRKSDKGKKVRREAENRRRKRLKEKKKKNVGHQSLTPELSKGDGKK